MKQQYQERQPAYASYEKTRTPLVRANANKDLLIAWGKGKNLVYITASQAINFIQLSKDSDIN